MDRDEKSFKSRTGIDIGIVMETRFDSTSETITQKVAAVGHSQYMCTNVPVVPKVHRVHVGSAIQFIR